MGLAGADMKLSEARYDQALRDQAAQKAVFPDLGAQAIADDYPGRCQSLTQVLSAADARLVRLSERKS